MSSLSTITASEIPNKSSPLEVIRIRILRVVALFVIFLMVSANIGFVYYYGSPPYSYFIEFFLFALVSVIVFLLLHFRFYTLGKYVAVYGWGGLLLLREFIGNEFIFQNEPFCILIAIGGVALFNSKKQQAVNFIFAVLLLFITSYNLFFPFKVPTELLPSDVNSDFITYLSLLVIFSIILYILVHSIIKNEQESIAQLKKIENLKLEQKKHLANVAYEIETQIGIVMKHTNHLSTEPSKSEFFSKIQKHSNQLLEFSHQISDLINEDVNEGSLSIVRFQLPSLIQELLANFQSAAQAQNIHLTTTAYIPDVEIISDVDKLYVILKSLISNALKYSSKDGNISINVMVQGTAIQIIIQDDGIGIAPEDLPHIFNRYFKNTSVELPLLEGTGINLNACKKYLELLGGTITATSKLNEGSTFTVTFLKQLPTDARSIVKPFNFTTFSETTFSSKKTDTVAIDNEAIKHLLIVENNVVFYDFFKSILDTEFRFDFMPNVAEAWDFLQNRQTDLIIIDLNLLAIDDMALLKKIKEDEALKELPILLLTTKTALSSQIQAMRMGINDYIFKPLDGNVLKNHIKLLLNIEETEEIIVENEIAVIAEETDLSAEELTDSPIPLKNSKTLDLSREDKIWLEQFEETVLRLFDDVYLNIDMVANEMSISSTHLNRKANAILGISPKKYILEVRLNTAKKMLESKTFNSVKAVAYSSGFKSEKVFSKNFKKRFEQYPSEVLSKKSP